MSKEKILMDRIKNFIIQECQAEFDYAGVAETDDYVSINSGKDKDLIINIKIRE